MKNILLICMISITVFYSYGQSYTSAIDGNWTSPTTWNPPGVPINFTDVTINHNVTLNTDFIYSSGTITVNTGASLVQDIPDRRFVINGGSLINSGTFTVDTFAIFSGDFDNIGTSNTSIVYLNGYVTNYGIMDNIDSLYNDFELINDTGEIYADQLFNAYYLSNDGYIEGTNYFNDGEMDNNGEIGLINFFNADTAYNMGDIYFTDHTNTGYMENHSYMEASADFTNAGTFENYSQFEIANDFSNVDSVYNDALFYNEGLVNVGNNWFNADTIDGTSTGQFCIQNNTGNTGEMYGHFDFCDQTPPGTPPYIDYNTNYIDPTITYCLLSCGTDIRALDRQSVTVFPNPAINYLMIENIPEQCTRFCLYNCVGQIVYQTKINHLNQVISLENIGKGMYIYIIMNSKGEKLNSEKLIIK